MTWGKFESFRAEFTAGFRSSAIIDVLLTRLGKGYFWTNYAFDMQSLLRSSVALRSRYVKEQHSLRALTPFVCTESSKKLESRYSLQSRVSEGQVPDVSFECNFDYIRRNPSIPSRKTSSNLSCASLFACRNYLRPLLCVYGLPLTTNHIMQRMICRAACRASRKALRR
jgi:hypothetical protein